MAPRRFIEKPPFLIFLTSSRQETQRRACFDAKEIKFHRFLFGTVLKGPKNLEDDSRIKNFL